MTLIDKKFSYAVIGASNDPTKYGHIILKDLLNAGYRAIPVNPKGESILGQKTYKSIYDIPERVDVAIFVVPPEVTENILHDIVKKGIKKIWMQPGSESDNTIAFCEKNGLEFVFGSCIMLQK